MPNPTDKLTAARLRLNRAADRVGVRWDEYEKAFAQGDDEPGAAKAYLAAVDEWTMAIRDEAEANVEFTRQERRLYQFPSHLRH